MFLWNLYLLLPSSFLYILAWSLSELFTEIRKEMECAFADGKDVGRFVQESAERHSLVCQAVWKLNVYFRNIMLVNVACIFASSINYFYFMVDKFNERNFTLIVYYSSSFLMLYLVIYVIGYATECLKEKVNFRHLTSPIHL